MPRLKRVAERSPVNIVVCTGYYTWHELPFAFKFKPTWGDRLKMPPLEELLVEDIEVSLDAGRAGVGRPDVAVAGVARQTEGA